MDSLQRLSQGSPPAEPVAYIVDSKRVTREHWRRHAAGGQPLSAAPLRAAAFGCRTGRRVEQRLRPAARIEGAGEVGVAAAETVGGATCGVGGNCPQLVGANAGATAPGAGSLQFAPVIWLPKDGTPPPGSAGGCTPKSTAGEPGFTGNDHSCGLSARRLSSTVPTSIDIASSAGGTRISIACGSDAPISG